MSKKTLVIGASLKVDRYSNFVIHKLINHNHEVIAIGLKEGDIGGVTIETELLPFEDVDTVTLYLNPKRQKPYYDYIKDLKPNRVIFNPGTENPEFYELLKEAGIHVEIACTLVLLSTNQY
ncbi:CoA-binding protein [Aquimarina sp. D1M17]|uniref:CoA-binding protein n=1 Tax=Aquimarina acroporae TaxID=2937283 RepID=UPI0020C04DAF|nr:CoA-binding protein [Aquimarina acroporae]MCK8522671.1 CoA-binding protein [Aquimarina acroporae]